LKQPDIPEDEPEVPNIRAAASANEEPSIVEGLVEEVRKLREQVLAQQPREDRPDGKWNYIYKNQSHLRVMGGLEVENPPGWEPFPPSGIPRYVAVGGGTTDHIEAPLKTFPKFDAVGNPLLGDDGMPVYTEVPIAKAAEKDADGKPVKTEEYKLWLHMRAKGKRLGSDVMSDIAAGKGLPAGAVIADGITIGDNGIPITQE